MITLEEATKQYIAIVDQIQESLSTDQRKDIRDELYEFRKGLPRNSEFEDLRFSIGETRIALNRAIGKASLEKIKGRTGHIIRHTTAINGLAVRAKKDAASARMENLQRVLDVTNSVTAAAMEAKKSIDEDRDDDAYDAIDKIIKELAKLKLA